MMRTSENGDKLSPEMLLIMCLIVEDKYLLFPDSLERNAR